jgi:hypothetical protein
MMKKLLVLLILVGLTSMASAALQISVDGVQEPVDSEIWLEPSDTIYLDIWTDTDITPGNGEWAGWALVVNPANGSISGGMPVVSDAGIVIYDDALGNGFPSSPENGVWGMLALSELSIITAGSTIYDEIIFHCESEPDDAIVHLYGTNDWVTPILLDTVIIHQPEPMTVALLGLGGLFLRRRR